MGKRELVLVTIFVVLGIVVYQFTAPPAAPGSEGFSVGGVLQNIRRGIQGPRESATSSFTQTFPVEAEIRQVRFVLPRNGDLKITGSDRSDVSVEMNVTARGFDQEEAKALADGAKLTLAREGDAVVISGLPPMTGRRGRTGFVSEAVLTVSVPKRLGVWLAPHPGKLTLSNVARGEIMGARGEVTVTAITDQLTVSHSGGDLEVDGVGSLKLTGRNSRGTVRHVRGTMSLDTVGADLTLSDIAGPLDIEARNSDVHVESIKGLKAPLRVNTTGGKFRIEGLATEARIDGRNTGIEVAMSAAAPVTIYSTGDDIDFTPPPSGYTLDAVTTDGRITIDDGSIKPSGETDQRASGTVRGGGPTLTLRATRGRLDVRRAAGK